jgi:hypothetical protein
MYRAWLAEKLYLVVLGGGLLIVQGDGMGMVLVTALMASFFFGKRTQLYKRSLRWGLLAIGAAAFVDMFATWYSGNIPFGEIEGTGLSDPMKLVEEHGWPAKLMVRRYIRVGVACLSALALMRRAWLKARN